MKQIFSLLLLLPCVMHAMQNDAAALNLRRAEITGNNTNKPLTSKDGHGFGPYYLDVTWNEISETDKMLATYTIKKGGNQIVQGEQKLDPDTALLLRINAKNWLKIVYQTATNNPIHEIKK